MTLTMRVALGPPEGLDIDLSHFRILQEFNLGYILLLDPSVKEQSGLAYVHLGDRV